MRRVGCSSGGSALALDPAERIECRHKHARIRRSETAASGSPKSSNDGDIVKQSKKYDDKLKNAKSADSSSSMPENFATNSTSLLKSAAVVSYGSGVDGRCRMLRAASLGV